jgi:hypothetical protein
MSKHECRAEMQKQKETILLPKSNVNRTVLQKVRNSKHDRFTVSCQRCGARTGGDSCEERHQTWR